MVSMRHAVTRLRATVAAAAAGLMLAAGCGPRASTAGLASSVNGTGPVTFAIGQDGAPLFDELIAPWNKAHPGERVTLAILPQDENGQLAQLQVNLQARSPAYDVIEMDVVWTAEFASAGWVIPINQGDFPLGSFLQPAVDTAMYRGHLWGVPYNSNADLLYYRKDILAAAHKQPPATLAQLEELAKTVAPEYGLQGYAGQLSQYEGLTVNFADAVQSEGGSILGANGTAAAVTSPQAQAGLSFLVDGLREGWIPGAALGYEEESSACDFELGKLLFLNNWPFIYSQASTPGPIPAGDCQGAGNQPGPDNQVVGKFGVTQLPGVNGPGSSSLGGYNLAVSAFSKHQATAVAFIKYLTSLPEEKQLLIDTGLPPVWTSLYSDPAMVRMFPYLPVVKQAILSAQPRPAIPDYDQASDAIVSAVYQALTFRQTPRQALQEMAAQLTQIIGDG
jgi:multiple sugar transport system substrate-binding protein